MELLNSRIISGRFYNDFESLVMRGKTKLKVDVVQIWIDF